LLSGSDFSFCIFPGESSFACLLDSPSRYISQVKWNPLIFWSQNVFPDYSTFWARKFRFSSSLFERCSIGNLARKCNFFLTIFLVLLALQNIRRDSDSYYTMTVYIYSDTKIVMCGGVAWPITRRGFGFVTGFIHYGDYSYKWLQLLRPL
jgi:hypothetical protein